MRRAFSLVEILVCVAIVLVVVAIALPILSATKRSALQAETRSNLRQLYIGLELYRQEQDGADVGNLYALGLPPVDYYGLVMAKDIKPPLAGRYAGLGWYYLMPPEPQIVDPTMTTGWLKYNANCESGSILLVDVNFSEHSPESSSPLLPRIGYGVRLNGSISRYRKPGGPLSYGWWGCGP